MTSPEVRLIPSAFGGDAMNTGIDFHDGDGHGLVPSSHVSPFFTPLSLLHTSLLTEAFSLKPSLPSHMYSQSLPLASAAEPDTSAPQSQGFFFCLTLKSRPTRKASRTSRRPKKQEPPTSSRERHGAGALFRIVGSYWTTTPVVPPPLSYHRPCHTTAPVIPPPLSYLKIVLPIKPVP
ncbi:MAG: hypothetical protein J3Q66DRAFT_134204 [Benniella sp.]|nr:MAG: hypothetical protein J3Q66DRAFT_134204 [Benniella sp.]